jgi:branched-chain amino acid transport system substrate-binding protein
MRAWRQKCALGCAVLCIALGASRMAQAQTTGVFADRVVFGQSAKLSGTGGTQAGKQYQAGLQLAFDLANRTGGVHGRRLQLKSLDDGNDGQRAVANTRELVAGGSFALVGYTFQGPVRAALPVVRETGIPFIAPYAGMPELYAAGLDNQIFLFRASVADEWAAIVRHIETVGFQEIALVHYTNAFGEEMRQDLSARLKAIGLKFVATGAMPINPKDSMEAVKPAIAAISATCPKVVVLAVSGRDAAAVVRSMQARHCTPRYYARHLVDITLLVKELGSAANGIMVTQLVPNPHRGLHPLVREYREQQTRRDATLSPDFTEFEGFIVGRFIVQALQRYGKDLDRRRFIQAMQATRLDGPGTYRIQFGAANRAGTHYINFVMISDKGRITD